MNASPKPLASVKTAKRGQGRPVSGQNDVGREKLLVATEKLLMKLPPARVTIARIAQEADVDPALVRYYFGNREALLVAVVDRVTAHPQRETSPKGDPATVLTDHIARTVALVRRAPFLHRLILDELVGTGTEESVARVGAMNADLVTYYRDLLKADGGRELANSNPLFLYMIILGASDFFTHAQPLIRDLLPKDADQDRLTADFQAFLADLVLNGLRKR